MRKSKQFKIVGINPIDNNIRLTFSAGTSLGISLDFTEGELTKSLLDKLKVGDEVYIECDEGQGSVFEGDNLIIYVGEKKVSNILYSDSLTYLFSS